MIGPVMSLLTGAGSSSSASTPEAHQLNLTHSVRESQFSSTDRACLSVSFTAIDQFQDCDLKTE